MQHKRFYDTGMIRRILLDETQPPPKQHQILKVGAFKHPKHGIIQITKEVLSDMVKNFNEKIRGSDIAWDYFHEFNGIASGWPTRLELRDNGNELWAETEWTPEAQRKLAERELRYFSPDFAFQWEHPETGVVYNNVLFGGALTNRPFLKEMQAIVADEGKNMNEENKEEIQMGGPGSGPQGGGAGKAGAGHKVGSKEWRQARRQANLDKSRAKAVAFTKRSNAVKAGIASRNANITQSRSNAETKELKKKLNLNENQGVQMDEKDKQIETLENQIAELMDQLDALKGEKVEMTDANKKLGDQVAQLSETVKTLKESQERAEAAVKLAEKENEFNVLLSEGKAVVAQKEAFIKGDMKEFIKLAENTNTKGKGASGGNSSEDQGDDEDATIKLAEEICDKQKISYSEAMKQARREHQAKKSK